ncbi:MAG TPA: Zn-ribbon domain-containing OB-fold protein [Anaerolineales bacterium]|nr:Zn-ribbon domain-containing OB-fold protein [Anaerolineales bacterium]
MTTTVEQRPFTSASFEQYLSEKKLMGSHCNTCNKDFLPPRAICPNCHSDQLTWIEFSGKGKLAAFTSIYIAPTAMIEAGYGRDNPYLAGVVELDEGVKISAQILGLDAKKPDEVKIGTPLQVEFVKRGEGETKKTFLAFRVV